MASKTHPVQPSPNGAPAVIRRNPLLEGEGSSAFMRTMPAWVVSAVLNSIILGSFLWVTQSSATATVETEQYIIESKVEDNPQDANLTNDDTGMKADANRIGDAHYFAVIVAGGTTGSPTFDRTIAQRGVICIACTTTQSTSLVRNGSSSLVRSRRVPSIRRASGWTASLCPVERSS